MKHPLSHFGRAKTVGQALTLGLLIAALPSPVRAGSAGALTWYRLPANCGESTVACGPHRSYAFGEPQGHSLCTPEHQNTEIPRLYPAAGADTGSNPDLPCYDRSCLAEGRPGAEPWVAMIDWDNSHGLTVAETVGRVSQGMPVHLFSLDAPEAVEMLGEQVGDAHVLIQLCAIAEQIEQNPRNPPQLVNLSFGRYRQTPPAVGGLESEIRDLIGELSSETHFVAAAGNDGLLLFPAAVPSVLAVGALDLAAFRQEIAAKSRISPVADAYFPAYGLLLESKEGTTVWPAPPGTSYASAIAAGWIAELLERNPAAGDTIFPPGSGPVLRPRRTAAGFELARGTVAIPGSRNPIGSRLLEIAIGQTLEVWQKLDQDEGPVLAEPLTETEPELPTRTWTEVRGRDNSPAPETYPCVPCANAPDPWGNVVGEVEPGAAILLDLGDAQSFGPGISLTGLYLQSGDTYLSLRGSEDAGLLGGIGSGSVKRLTVEGLPGDFRDRELLFVWVLQESASVNGNRFVHKSPISLVEWPR